MRAAEDVLRRCTTCHACVNECLFLMSIGKSPKEVSEEILGGMDLTKLYVFSCFLCELCTSVCPQRIDVARMFLEARSFLALDVIPSNPYLKLVLCDEPNSLINAYKERKRVDYEVLASESFQHAFLPGCSMIYFSPKSVLKIYEMLSRTLEDVGVLDVCCGKPMYDLGLKERATRWLIHGVIEELKKRKCRAVITACPNCYYYLKGMLPSEFKVITIYDVFGKELTAQVKDLKVTIHDSCPDRFDGIFAKKVREVLTRCTVIEMEHSRERTTCCGAGGLVMHTNPSLSFSLSNSRIQEALSTRAEILVTYCYTCASVLFNLQPPIKVAHVLDLLFEVEESYAARQEELLKLIAELMSKDKV